MQIRNDKTLFEGKGRRLYSDKNNVSIDNGSYSTSHGDGGEEEDYCEFVVAQVLCFFLKKHGIEGKDVSDERFFEFVQLLNLNQLSEEDIKSILKSSLKLIRLYHADIFTN